MLFFSDLESGPSTGWEESPTRGCAVSVWGLRLGTERDESYITVCGARLTKDSDYAEWAETINSALSLERIT